jgi:hypothetical protein
VTILASQVPEARAEATRLHGRDSDRAPAYAALLASVREALLAEEQAGGGPGDPNRRAVVADLERLEQALRPAGS